MLNAKQMAEWEAYFQLEPLGEDRADLRMARTCALLANINRKKNARLFAEKEFLFNFEPEEAQSADEMKAEIMKMKGA
jgi:hypothetical protein